jgi:hypothetical protein
MKSSENASGALYLLYDLPRCQVDRKRENFADSGGALPGEVSLSNETLELLKCNLVSVCAVYVHRSWFGRSMLTKTATLPPVTGTPIT